METAITSHSVTTGTDHKTAAAKWATYSMTMAATRPERDTEAAWEDLTEDRSTTTTTL